jgi:predicted kinase
MNSLGKTKPHLITSIGIPCSGKSFFADHFADTFKSPIISYNRLQKLLFVDPVGSKEEDEIILSVIKYMLEESFKTERTVVYDGPIFNHSSYEMIDKMSQKSGYEPLYVWVQIDSPTAKKRASNSSLGNLKLSSEQFDKKVSHFCPPKTSSKSIVVSGKHTYASQLKIVLKYLAVPS